MWSAGFGKSYLRWTRGSGLLDWSLDKTDTSAILAEECECDIRTADYGIYLSYKGMRVEAPVMQGDIDLGILIHFTTLWCLR